MSGRPTGSTLDPAIESGVATEAVVIDQRGRFTLPAWIADEIPWIRSARQAGVKCYALTVFSEPGVIRLLPWELSTSVIEKRRELVASKSSGVIRLLEHKYRRVLIAKDLRPVIGLDASAHLEVSADRSEFIYIVLEAGSFSLINHATLKKQITEAEEAGLFENLP